MIEGPQSVQLPGASAILHAVLFYDSIFSWIVVIITAALLINKQSALGYP